MKHIGLFLWIFLLDCAVQAQNNIVVLKKQLNSGNSGQNLCRLLYDLGVAYMEVKQDSSIYFLEQSLQIAQQTKDNMATAEAMQQLGYVYLHYVHNETKVLEWTNKAITVANKIPSNRILAQCYQHLAAVAMHQKIGNVEELTLKALDHAQKTTDWYVTSGIYNFASYYYSAVEQNYPKAEKTILKAMSVAEKHDGKRWISFALDYCEILETGSEKEKMRAFCNQIAVVAKKIGKDPNNYVLMNDLARLETKLENYPKAEKLYLEIIESEQAKPKSDTIRLLNTYRSLLSNYLIQNQFEKAYHTRTILSVLELHLKEKRQVETARVQMTKMQAALDIEKKEKEITILGEQQQRQLLYLIAAVLIAGLLISFVFVIQRNNRRIERQKVELSQLNATKDRLFAILSHDLRSPVASLKNYLMLIDWGALSQAEFVESTQDLKASVNNAHLMLENLLNWSMTQMGGLKPEFENVAVASVVAQQIEWQAAVAKEKNIEIWNNILPEAQLKIDRNHLGLIIRNLLQNALKFTPDGGQIVFNYRQSATENTLEIKDNGVGMPQAMVQDLFGGNPANSRAGLANEQGTGLGLVLVKDLVKLNGGQITVHSVPYQGTKFIISFE